MNPIPAVVLGLTTHPMKGFEVTMQVSPTEWNPSKEEMKKADKMDPGNEPRGLVEVIMQMRFLHCSASVNSRSAPMPCACKSRQSTPLIPNYDRFNSIFYSSCAPACTRMPCLADSQHTVHHLLI